MASKFNSVYKCLCLEVKLFSSGKGEQSAMSCRLTGPPRGNDDPHRAIVDLAYTVYRGNFRSTLSGVDEAGVSGDANLKRTNVKKYGLYHYH